MDRTHEHSVDGSDIPLAKRPRTEPTSSSEDNAVPQRAATQRRNLPLRARAGRSAAAVGSQEAISGAGAPQVVSDSLPPVSQALPTLGSIQPTAIQASQKHTSVQHPEVQPSQIHINLSLLSVAGPVYLPDPVAQSLELEALYTSLEALKTQTESGDKEMLALKARVQKLEATCKAQHETFARQIEAMRALLVTVRSRMNALEARLQRAEASK